MRRSNVSHFAEYQPMSCSIIYLGLDVHKESVTIAVLPATAAVPTRVDLTPARIPSEAEERVRDLVRCRETFQREIQKSRHYLQAPPAAIGVHLTAFTVLLV